MTKTKVRNPGPAALLVVNGGNMARRRRRVSNTRRTKVARRRNPVHHRSRRRRNPTFGAGLFQRGVAVAAGGMLTQAIAGYIPAIGGASPIADIGRTLGAAWGAGFVVEKIGGRYFAKYANDIMLGGVAVAGAKVIGLLRSYVLPKIQGAVAGTGVSDVITLPRGSYDSYYGSTPMLPRGMGDVITMPRFQNY